MNAEEIPARAKPPRPGDPGRIGTYEVLGFLGEGGMGSVFVGRDPDGALVAIKVIRPELAAQPEFRARFRREAASAMLVPRFCTAEVMDADTEAEAPYLVTEFVDAPTLNETVRTAGPLRRAELEQLAVNMAAALVGIHAAGIVHRDLKPANVLLSRMGPRVIDFGVAKAVDATRLTADDQTVGTPAYMAPEQLRGRPCPASDVFGWGGVMVFAATGRRPFGGTTLPAMAAAILNGEPNLTGLSGRLRDVVAAALANDPAARPAPAALLEMFGVAPADLVTPSPGDGTRIDTRTPPDTDQTRTDLTTRAFTAPSVQTSSAEPSPPGAQPPPVVGTSGARPTPAARSVPPAVQGSPIAPMAPGDPTLGGVEPPGGPHLRPVARASGARPIPSAESVPPAVEKAAGESAAASGEGARAQPAGLEGANMEAVHGGKVGRARGADGAAGRGAGPVGGASAPSEWPTSVWTPKRMRKRRRLPLRAGLAMLLAGAVIGAVLVWLAGRDEPVLAVTGVSVRADRARYGCDADVDVTGKVITNGGAGQIDYQWKRSDQKKAGAPLREVVRGGGKETTVHLLWRISGPGKRGFTATLVVLNAPNIRKSTTFTYSCQE